MDTTSDEALIGRIAAGDKAAMQLLFERYQIKVLLALSSGSYATKQPRRI